MRLLAFATLGVGVLTTTPSFAATVEPLHGQVSINRGDGIFRPISSALQATIGDLIIVSPNGSARIIYPDGCAVEVKPGEVVPIMALSPCKAPSDLTSNPSNDFTVGTTLALGAAVGGATILFLLNSKNDDKPASP
jgi:hypothetical protein